MSEIKLVLLWSDVLIFSLAFSLLAFFALLKKNPLARKRWLSIFQSTVGSLSLIIILFYVLIALLDSVHYRRVLPSTDASNTHGPKSESQAKHYSYEVESLLDWILSDLKNHSERTYSAPFAIHSFVKETMQDENGKPYRDYARLKHGGSHLNDESDRAFDIFWRSALAVLWGLLISVVLIMLWRHWRNRWAMNRSAMTADLPWSVYEGTVVFLVLVSCWILQLGAHYHIFGTDKVGTDVLYMSIKSVRTGILIGCLATLLTLPFAIGFGISAGYFKGKIDDAIQFIYTTLSSIPDILLIAAAVLVLDVYIETHTEQFQLLIERSDFKFLTLCAILGITSWTGLCRLLRAESLKVSQLDYVQAAIAFGVSHTGILFRHILPNVMHLVLIAVVLNFSSFVLAEAVLSYIGVGVDASMHSWGNMINAARQELSRDPTVWWTILAAFVWMFVLVLAANLFADQVREAFDPRVYHKPSGGANS